MKIAVSATGNNLDSAIDPRFGRCAFFKVPGMVCVNKFDLNPNQGRAIEDFAREREIRVVDRNL